MSYYDIDAILTDAEKIPCEFQIDAPELGYLDNSPSLKSGAKVALPLWLAEMLALANTTNANDPSSADDGRSFVTLNLPGALADDVVHALKADPRSVPIRDRSPHFYSLATRILDLFEERELAGVLRRAYVVRAGDVGLHARKAGGGGSSGSASAGHHHHHHAGGKGTQGHGGAGSNVGLGAAGEEFLRGLDEWERTLFRKAHDGTKSGREWMENVKKY